MIIRRHLHLWMHMSGFDVSGSDGKNYWILFVGENGWIR